MPPTSIENELLVSTDWVDEHRSDDNVRIVESDEDLLLYQQGHIIGTRRSVGNGSDARAARHFASHQIGSAKGRRRLIEL